MLLKQWRQQIQDDSLCGISESLVKNLESAELRSAEEMIEEISTKYSQLWKGNCFIIVQLFEMTFICMNLCIRSTQINHLTIFSEKEKRQSLVNQCSDTVPPSPALSARSKRDGTFKYYYGGLCFVYLHKIYCSTDNSNAA